MEEFTVKLNAPQLKFIRQCLGQAQYDAAEPVIRTIGEQIAEQEKMKNVLTTRGGDEIAAQSEHPVV